MDGLVCRNNAAYEYFLGHPELGPYLYRAMDDTILNISNLLRHIDKLNQVYNPWSEFVFRGFANDELPDQVYLGGGSGWLISRPLVALHRRRGFTFAEHFATSWLIQDDTTETIIVQKVFGSAAVWSDPLWSEHCLNCDGPEFLRGNFSALERCPRGPTYSVNDIIAFHPRSELPATVAGLMLGRYPKDIHYYHEERSTSIRLCRRKWLWGRSYLPTVQSLAAQAVHLTAAVFPE